MGFFLAELLVVLALAAMITLGASVVIVHTLRVSNQNNEWGIVVHETGTAAYWIGHDLAMADAIYEDDPTTPDNELLTLVWKDWATGDIYNVHYAVLEGAGSLNRIERRYYHHQEFEDIDNTTTITVAENIYLANMTRYSDHFWELSIISRSGSHDLLNEYDLYSRLNYSEMAW